MKSFLTATIFGLISCSIAAPTTSKLSKRQSSSCVEPNQNQVLQAIQKWNNDVSNVNTFLNAAPSQNPPTYLTPHKKPSSTLMMNLMSLEFSPVSPIWLTTPKVPSRICKRSFGPKKITPRAI